MDDENREPEKRAETILSALSLAGLIAGFRTYTKTWRDILRYRHRYGAEILAPIGSKALGPAIAVFLYGAILAFIIYFPFGRMHGSPLPKLLFVLSEAYEAIVFIVLTHLVVRIFRGRGTFGQTAAVYLTWMGAILPLVFICFAPVLAHTALKDLLGTTEVMFPPPANPVYWVYMFVSVALVLCAMLMTIVVVCYWLSAVHQLRKRWLVVGFLFVFLPLQLLQQRFLSPYVAVGLREASELITSLL